MKIILTSFRDALKREGDIYSIARWQPGNFPQRPMFPVDLRPITSGGRPMTHMTPLAFRKIYWRLLNGQGQALLQYLHTRYLADQESPVPDLVLCCWCNLDRQEGYDKLYCHRILVGYWIEKHFIEIQRKNSSHPCEIEYDDGAQNPIWTKEEVYADIDYQGQRFTRGVVPLPQRVHGSRSGLHDRSR